jgi:cysteinyl-tRNA synthetase, unknown class
MKNLPLKVAVLASQLAHFVCAELTPASFAYILQADSFAKTKPAAVAKLKESGRDWIVLDATFAGDTPWEQSDLDTIRSGKEGRKVVAYLSIGEAEDYRPYWQSEWVSNGKRTATAPAWLGIENPEWKGNYQIKYWNAEWQKLMLAAIDDAMSRGFDGVYLDIVDGFQTYEQGADDYLDDRMNPETQQTYRRDMVDWVKAIASRTRAKNPTALVIPQNGSQLAAHKDFVEVISAQGIEDLFTNGKKLQPASHTDEILGHLKTLASAKKPVLLIEYPKTPERQALSKKLAKENGLVWLVTDRQLKTLGESGK